MKKVLVLSLILGLFVSLNFAQTTKKVELTQSGGFYLDKNTSGYNLDNGSGLRSFDYEVKFNPPFKGIPTIYVGVQLIDKTDNSIMRYSLEPYAVSRDGFVVKVATWGDTKLNAIAGSWLASYEELIIEEETVKVGETIQLRNVFFAFNKADLLPTSHDELNKVIDFMKKNASVEIEVSGHTDNKGADDYNMDLSQKRAESVKTYLTSNGIDGSRIASKGYGETKPIATNSTEYGREQNRRVEFTITKK